MLECPKYSSSFGHRYVSIFKMLLKGTDRLCKIVKTNSKEFDLILEMNINSTLLLLKLGSQIMCRKYSKIKADIQVVLLL